MALKVGTEDKKKVYLATGLGLGHAHPAGAFSVADLRAFAGTAAGPATGGHGGTSGDRQAAKHRKRTRPRRLMPTRRQRSAA